jgi:hypothetical protein
MLEKGDNLPVRAFTPSAFALEGPAKTWCAKPGIVMSFVRQTRRGNSLRRITWRIAARRESSTWQTAGALTNPTGGEVPKTPDGNIRRG